MTEKIYAVIKDGHLILRMATDKKAILDFLASLPEKDSLRIIEKAAGAHHNLWMFEGKPWKF